MYIYEIYNRREFLQIFPSSSFKMSKIQDRPFSKTVYENNMLDCSWCAAWRLPHQEPEMSFGTMCWAPRKPRRAESPRFSEPRQLVKDVSTRRHHAFQRWKVLPGGFKVPKTPNQCGTVVDAEDQR